MDCVFKGAIHIHSTYSDGEFTLAELRENFIAAGCDFLCMTDHAESFDEEKARAYVSELEDLSDDRFRFVPGMEFECEQRMHILGFGVTALANTTNPEKVIRHIEDHGGVSVIAHPMDSFFPWIETFATLPRGIETWNSKYDGRYAPRTGTFRLLNRLQQRKPEMKAFYGMDLHFTKQYRGLYNLVDCQALSRSEILRAFASGNYKGIKGELELPSTGLLSNQMQADFERIHAKSDRLRLVLKKMKNAVKNSGVPVPASIKSQLRRLF